MLDRIKQFISNSRLTQFLLVLLAGVAIGAIFYPTKHIEERERLKHEEELRKVNEQHSVELSSVTEMYTSLNASYQQYHSETEKKIFTLTQENTILKTKVKTAFYKIVRPDGTIEIKKFTESEVDESRQVITSIQEEFRQKIDSIETKWETIHKNRVENLSKEYKSKEEEYKRKITELEKSRVVDINKKSFGVEAGLLTSGNYYGHATYDVFGPFFLGLHGQFGAQSAAGGGLGIRF